MNGKHFIERIGRGICFGLTGAIMASLGFVGLGLASTTAADAGITLPTNYSPPLQHLSPTCSASVAIGTPTYGTVTGPTPPPPPPGRLGEGPSVTPVLTVTGCSQSTSPVLVELVDPNNRAWAISSTLVTPGTSPLHSFTATVDLPQGYVPAGTEYGIDPITLALNAYQSYRNSNLDWVTFDTAMNYPAPK